MIVSYVVRTIVIPLVRIIKDLGIIILLTINTFTKERRAMSSSTSTSKQHGKQKDNRVFHHFPMLTPDLKVYILSFITCAPFEPVVVTSDEKTSGLLKRKITRSTAKTVMSYRSTLTDCLPLVNKEFYIYCTKMDIYWRQSLIRMITQNESVLWTSALEHIVSIAESSNNTSSNNNTCTNNDDEMNNNNNNDKTIVDYVLNYEDGDDDDDDDNTAGDDGIVVSSTSRSATNLTSNTTSTTTNAAVPTGNTRTGTTTTTKPEAVPKKLIKNTSTGSSSSCTEVVQDSFLLDDTSLKSFNVTIPPETVSLLHRAYKVIAQSSSTTTITKMPAQSKTTKIKKSTKQAALEVDNTEAETETENMYDEVYYNSTTNTSIYRELYKRILNDGLRHTGYPVFIMPSKIVLGQPYGLHLFEPRYRLLIAEVMRPYPQSARSGGPIPSSIQVSTSSSATSTADSESTTAYEPVFVHAFHHTRNGNSTDGTIGVLVRIVQCLINNGDGRANVLLLPYQYVWLEKLWVRPNTQNLVYCQSRILGQKEIQHLSSYYGLE